MSIRNKALELLARREHSRAELKHKLLVRFDGEASNIEYVLDCLEEEKLLSDSRFTEMFIQARLYKGYGPNRIEAELLHKGVDSAVVNVVMNGLDVDWVASLATLSQKKYGDLLPKSEQEKMKRIRYFQYKGYSYEHISNLVF